MLLVAVVAGCGGGGLEDVGERIADVPLPLRDGRHFGFVRELDPVGLRLVFDDAELLEGQDAARAARDDGLADLSDNFYVKNVEEDDRELVLDPALEVRLLQPCCQLHEVPFTDWFDGFEPDERSFYGTSRSHYWITLDGGKVVRVEEAYLS